MASEQPSVGAKTRWGWRAFLCILALVSGALGLALGFGFSAGRTFHEVLQDPVARIGLRLVGSSAEPSRPKGFPPLEVDIRASESRLIPRGGKLLRLVLALRGINESGEVDFVRAKELCEELDWQRCDDAALKRMAEELEK